MLITQEAIGSISRFHDSRDRGLKTFLQRVNWVEIITQILKSLETIEILEVPL